MSAHTILTNPVALLAAAVIVVAILGRVMRFAFHIILLFAVVGAVAVAGGAAKLPLGISIDSLARGLTGSVTDAASTGKAVFGPPAPKPAKSDKSAPAVTAAAPGAAEPKP